jgi:hypothetical protein
MIGHKDDKQKRLISNTLYSLDGRNRNQWLSSARQLDTDIYELARVSMAVYAEHRGIIYKSSASEEDWQKWAQNLQVTEPQLIHDAVEFYVADIRMQHPIRRT